MTPVINLATFAHVPITAPNSPLRTFADVLQRQKAKAGSTSVASSGNGTSTHLTAEMVNSLAGIKLNHVPYKGGGAALADVMGGQVDAMFIGSPPAMPLLASGKRKAMAVTTSKRMAALPDVRARWAQLGADPVATTPAQFASWLDSESVKWSKVVKESGAQPD